MQAQSVTLHLSEPIIRRAHQAANALQRPIEDVLTNILDATLPNISHAPVEMQADLARMAWLSDQELWAIAHEMMSEKEQTQLRYLSDLQTQRALILEEKETLSALRQTYGRVTVRKARAYALLSLRGGSPLLQNA